MIRVDVQCAPFAWFVEVRHADAFAEHLRRAGILGVQVIDADPFAGVREALADLRSAVEALPGECHGVCDHECEAEAEAECGAVCGAICGKTIDLGDVDEAIDALERVIPW